MSVRLTNPASAHFQVTELKTCQLDSQIQQVHISKSQNSKHVSQTHKSSKCSVPSHRTPSVKIQIVDLKATPSEVQRSPEPKTKTKPHTCYRSHNAPQTPSSRQSARLHITALPHPSQQATRLIGARPGFNHPTVQNQAHSQSRFLAKFTTCHYSIQSSFKTLLILKVHNLSQYSVNI